MGAPPPQAGGSGTGSKAKATLAVLTTALCYTISWSCVIIAIAFQIAAVLPAWTWVYHDPELYWQNLRALIVIKYELLEGYTLFEGWDGLQLTFIWAPPIIASIFTVLPTLFFSKETREAGWALHPFAGAARLGRWMYRMGSTPMWPARFWLWWCDGLTVFEALLLAGWLVAHFITLKEMTAYYTHEEHIWEQLNINFPVPQSITRLKWISLAFAWVLYIDLTLLFFPIAHLSFLQHLLGSSWAAVVKYHRWLGHFTMAMVTGHGVFYYWYWLADPDVNFWEALFDWNKMSYINFFAGTLGMLFGWVLWVTSLAWVRRRFFQVFYSTHMIGFVGFIFFTMIHYYWSWTYIAPGLALWLLDIVYRAFQAQHVTCVSSVHVTPSGTLARLEVPVDESLARNMKPGQHVFLQFPGVSRWQWHPFTVLQVNDEVGSLPTLTIAIKKYARWTKAVVSSLQSSCAVPVRMVGPTDHFDHTSSNPSHLVIFAGGIGATPTLALLHNLRTQLHPPTTTLVFTARNPEEFSVIDECIMQEAHKPGSWLKVHLFSTATSGCGCAPRCSCPDSSAGKATGQLDKALMSQLSASGSDRSSSDQTLPMPLNKVVGSNGGAMAPTPAGATGGSMRYLSCFGWSAHAWPLQPRLLNKWQMFAALLLAWGGAFMGAVQGQAALVEKWYPAWTMGDFWLCGIIFFFSILIQAAGLPTLLVVFPVQLSRYLSVRRRSLPPPALPKAPYITVLGPRKVGLPESGLDLDITTGRPDIQRLLRDAVQGATGEEVPVVVAGPRPMYHAVCLAALRENSQRAKSQPPLRIVRDAYEM